MTRPFFTVIIPTCNRQDALSLCLDRLAEDQQKSMRLIPAGKTNGDSLNDQAYEVIVSDDSQDTATQAWVETHYPWVRYCRGPQRGPAANRNNGAKQAHGIWLLFTDDDCLPQENWIVSYFNGVKKHSNANAVEGPIYTTEKIEGDLVFCPSNESGGNFWSANIGIKKELFDKLHGFDESFPYAAMEDMDLHARIKKETQIPFIRQSIVYHPTRKVTLLEAIAKENKCAASRGYLLVKHPEEFKATNLVQVIKQEYSYYLRSLFQATRSFYPKRMLLKILSLIWFAPKIIYFYWTNRRKFS